jgi:hypothetical protein
MDPAWIERLSGAGSIASTMHQALGFCSTHKTALRRRSASIDQRRHDQREHGQQQVLQDDREASALGCDLKAGELSQMRAAC